MSETPGSQETRLTSIDALRGLDMLMIIGGAKIIRELDAAYGGPVLNSLAHQLEHAAWHGFRFYDLIFPLFLFLAGASLPFSMERRAARGDARGPLVRSAILRAFVLVLLGILYNGGLSLDGEPLRYASVLGRIGLAWLGAALAVIYLRPKTQGLLVVGILLGYWALLSWVSVPGWGAGDLASGHNFTDWIDQQFLPGRLYRGHGDPEGLGGILPAVGTALLGAFAGRSLMGSRDRFRKRATVLILAGVACLALGFAWHQCLPFNKNLWTSSFVVYCAGWSSILLGIASLLLDGPKARTWSLPLIVIGMNPIAAYLLHHFLDFEGIANALVTSRMHTLLGALILQGLLLAWLHNKRWFLRV